MIVTNSAGHDVLTVIGMVSASDDVGGILLISWMTSLYIDNDLNVYCILTYVLEPCTRVLHVGLQWVDIEALLDGLFYVFDFQSINQHVLHCWP